MAVVNGTTENFQSEVLTANQPVLVDFWATWCGYCTRLSPVLDEIAVDMGDQLKVVKVNVDENRELADQYAVRSLPTLLLFKDGKTTGAPLVGYSPKAGLLAKLKPLL